MKLLSIQVGLPRTLGRADADDPMDREWTSGFHKETVPGPVAAGPTGLAGDGQADLKNHGGPDKAINAYPADHRTYWHTEYGLVFPAGPFGENFTTEGLTEADVCIGDVFQVGGIVVQISQPRQPCWKLARRWRLKDFAARVEQTGRTGWYFRVLDTGLVAAPATFTLTARPHPEWTIAEANAVMHHRKTDWDAALALSACPALAESWRTKLAHRANSSTQHRREGGPLA
jgi:MOSC domain-containing protein YiiM